MAAPGHLTISLDFELLWGMHDRALDAGQRSRLKSVHRVVPRLLELFYEHEVHATWATVGALGCADLDDLRSTTAFPHPGYRAANMSPWRLLDSTFAQYPTLFFAPELVRMIATTPGQELASHTFSHFFCLEEGADPTVFAEDLRLARRMGERYGIPPESLVFPRNQYSETHLRIAKRSGFTSYRGTPASWAYRSRSDAETTPVVRALRLMDTYLPLANPSSSPASPIAGIRNIAATRFLRPLRRGGWSGFRLRRVLSEMRTAARLGQPYHLWWHPHNCIDHTEDSLAYLAEILTHHRFLRSRFGFRNLTMREAARSHGVPPTNANGEA